MTIFKVIVNTFCVLARSEINYYAIRIFIDHWIFWHYINSLFSEKEHIQIFQRITSQ